MGSCLGANRSQDLQNYGNSRYPAIGKNQRLCKEHPKWKSDVTLTEGQLRSKRDEFWDTAPAFEGQKEIWDALKAAASALEDGDNVLAQAIIDGANIALPHGTLLDCYDELGTHYQLPVYCLSSPVNLIRASTDSSSNRNSTVEPVPPICENDKSAVTIKMRFSSEKDVKLKVLKSDTIVIAKQRLDLQENFQSASQRWYFSGKLLTNQMKVEQCKLERGYVVQCLVNMPS